MSVPSNIPDLLTPQGAPADAQEQLRCLENAAKLVEDFSLKCAPGALDALLAASAAAPGEAMERALQLAQNVTTQTETLQAEIERFLSLTQRR